MLLRTLVLVAFGVSLAPAEAPRTSRAKRGVKIGVPVRKASGVKRRVKPPTKRQVPKAVAKPKRAKQLRGPKAAFVPCSASLPPQAPGAVAKKPKAKSKGGPQGLVANKLYMWPVGATLNVSFADGSVEARKAVAEIAGEWSKHANVKLAFFVDAEPPVSHVRVLFDDPNCNSALGTSSQYLIDTGDASMRLCNIDKQVGSEWFQRVVLHEFGHALGIEHEHQSPKAKFEWNKPFVYEYYEKTAGWGAGMVDQWIFRTIDPAYSDSSEYDPDSVMQYSFPAEFTTSGVAILGGYELSATDKAHIAKMYPGTKPKPDPKKPTKFYERLIAVRNDTTADLDVRLVHESKSAGKWAWAPASAPEAAPSIRLAAGEERTLSGPPSGRRVKVVAATTDGEQTWSAHATKPIVIASSAGYRDREPQTWVVAIGGPPDAKALGRDALYDAASAALAKGDNEVARSRFAEFVARFPTDELAPWAELNMVIAWTGDRGWFDALQGAYDLVQGRPESDASNYALYYGGLAAMQLGRCDDAKAWFAWVVDPATGLASEWQAAAKDNLAEMKTNPKTWCD
jgi:prepilin-type processing-associated H-X9-DG protein